MREDFYGFTEHESSWDFLVSDNANLKCRSVVGLQHKFEHELSPQLLRGLHDLEFFENCKVSVQPHNLCPIQGGIQVSRLII